MVRTVTLAQLKSQLDRHLKFVQTGEQVIVKDGNRPIAQIVPIPSGAKTGSKKIDWDRFDAIGKDLDKLPDLTDATRRAIDEERGGNIAGILRRQRDSSPPRFNPGLTPRAMGGYSPVP